MIDATKDRGEGGVEDVEEGSKSSDPTIRNWIEDANATCWAGRDRPEQNRNRGCDFV